MRITDSEYLIIDFVNLVAPVEVLGILGEVYVASVPVERATFLALKYFMIKANFHLI